MTALERQLTAALKRHLAGQPPRPPQGAELLWNAFSRLSERRRSGFNGPEAIAFTEIESFARLMRMPLEPHHVRAIEAMDRLWLERAVRKPELPPLSVGAFDGMRM